MSKERRNFSRVKFQSNIKIEFNNEIYKAELLDISLNGALIEVVQEIPLSIADHCKFTLQLDSNDITIYIEATVQYKTTATLGIKFETIELDSMIHLRRLVELNVGNSDQVKQELFFLVSDP